jgi:hypothetical protein
VENLQALKEEAHLEEPPLEEEEDHPKENPHNQ